MTELPPISITPKTGDEAFSPDTIVLTEFRNNRAGGELNMGLEKLGLVNQHFHEAPAKINSVLIASNQPFTIDPPCGKDFTDRHRAVFARFENMNVAGFYFAQKERKEALFQFILGLPRHYLGSKTIVVGDFNTGKHYIDEAAATFFCSEYIDKMEAAGWIDAWRLIHNGRTEYSWYSRSGNGFRIDHAFVSPSLKDAIVAADYSHKERELGISDHSLLKICVLLSKE